VSGLVEVARFLRPFEADLARLFLGSYGVSAVVFDTGSQGYSDGALVNVRLMVLEEDLDEALEALRDYRP
jgi:Putative prokaryotic signal transducing protein